MGILQESAKPIEWNVKIMYVFVQALAAVHDLFFFFF
jgi:hypothetical protein